MQQVIGNIKIETEQPIKVIEVSLLPILLVITLLAGGLLLGTILRRDRPQQAYIESRITTTMEHVYMQAQIDALNGQLRIRPTDDGDYEWVDSPWSGAEVRFQYLSQYQNWQQRESR